MWREVELHQNIRIAPMFINQNIRQKIREELHSKVEGQITREYGMVLGITDDEITTGPGRVSQRTGYVLFDVKFRALICCPSGGDIVDAEIKKVSHHGIRGEAGPVEIFVAAKNIPNGEFDMESVVWKVASPNEDGGRTVLAPGTVIRVRIISAAPNNEMTRITAPASLMGEGLGAQGTFRS